jgi:hypothetical protein
MHSLRDFHAHSAPFSMLLNPDFMNDRTDYDWEDTFWSMVDYNTMAVNVKVRVNEPEAVASSPAASSPGWTFDPSSNIASDSTLAPILGVWQHEIDFLLNGIPANSML